VAGGGLGFDDARVSPATFYFISFFLLGRVVGAAAHGRCWIARC